MAPPTSQISVQLAAEQPDPGVLVLEGQIITAGAPLERLAVGIKGRVSSRCVLGVARNGANGVDTPFTAVLAHQPESEEELALAFLASFASGQQRAFLSPLPLSQRVSSDQSLSFMLGVDEAPIAELCGAVRELLAERRKLPLEASAQNPVAASACRPLMEHRTPPPLAWQPEAAERLRICIATNDFAGPIRNGGIGTACRSLAEELVRGGHRVTVAYTVGDYCEVDSADVWVDRLRAQGIEFVPLNKMAHVRRDNGARGQSYELYHWLKSREFDWIHFSDWRGIGFHSAQAKSLGCAFQSTLLSVTMHSPNRWHLAHNSQFIADFEGEEIDLMERETLRLVDLAISPSAYMFEWAVAEGWELPDRCEVLQNIPALPATLAGGRRRGIVRPREIVFFGRLETRKGLKLFCDSIDLLQGKLSSQLGITFLGKEGSVGLNSGSEYIRSRSKRWQQRVTIHSAWGQQEAVEYLRDGERLAVIASLIDNSPCTVSECLHLRIPFVASAVGGVPELMHADDRGSCLFAPDAPSLTQTLERALNQGIAVARPRYSPDELRAAWLELHEASMRQLRKSLRPLSVVSSQPLVSICITHYNRPHYLAQALASTGVQHYPNIEVIVVDDGSTDEAAQAYLDDLSKSDYRFPLRVIRQANAYVGAARNVAASVARGEYLVFLDDDNFMKPDAIAQLVRVAGARGVDVLTCAVDKFVGDSAPDSATQPVSTYVPLGSSLAAAPFLNTYGDIFALISRKTFLALGGFTEDSGITHEDWEFFSRAAIAGYSLEALPESLLWYRYSDESMSSVTRRFSNYRRSARPFTDIAPPFAKSMIEYGLHVRVTQLSPRPTGPRPNDVLRATELFHRAKVSILKLATPGELRLVSVISLGEAFFRWEGLHIIAEDSDPIVLLPHIEIAKHRQVVMKVTLTAPALTAAQLFYSRQHDPLFHEETSVNVPIYRGLSTNYLLLPEDRYSGFLRFDPGNRPGHYIIHQLEIREIEGRSR